MIDGLALAGITVAGWLYLRGTRRLRARGVRWAPTRTAAWYLGLGMLLVATQGPIGARDTTSFLAHVGQHLLLSMVGPPLLAMGAPLTLLLQSAGRPLQSRVAGILHNRFIRSLVKPQVGLALFAVGLGAYYFTGWYGASLSYEWLHELTHLHLTITGYVFFGPIVGADVIPGVPGFGARLMALGAGIPFHAFLAMALFGASTPLAAATYIRLTGATTSRLLASQRAGAALMWVAGEVITLALGGVALYRWRVQEQRVAGRWDRATITVESGQDS